MLRGEAKGGGVRLGQIVAPELAGRAVLLPPLNTAGQLAPSFLQAPGARAVLSGALPAPPPFLNPPRSAPKPSRPAAATVVASSASLLPGPSIITP